MRTLCEFMAIEVLPTVRALIAKRLVEVYAFSQQKAAERLGTTQPAISQYKHEVRGYKTAMLARDKKIIEIIDSISRRLASGEIDEQDASLEFCDICRRMRYTGMACEWHRKLYPSLESCTICKKLSC